MHDILFFEKKLFVFPKWGKKRVEKVRLLLH